MKNSNEFRILICIPQSERADILTGVVDCLKNQLEDLRDTEECKENNNIVFLKAVNKEQLEKGLSTFDCNVLIVSEVLEKKSDTRKETRVNINNIKQWKELYPELKVIMLTKKEAKGTSKLRSFLKNDFINAYYVEDISMEGDRGCLAELILIDRSYEAARRYYGIDTINNNRKVEVQSYNLDNVIIEKDSNRIKEKEKQEKISNDIAPAPLLYKIGTDTILGMCQGECIGKDKDGNFIVKVINPEKAAKLDFNSMPVTLMGISIS